MSKSSDLDLGQGVKTVTAAGTREILATGNREDVAVLSVTIKALSTNTGKVYVGDHNVSSSNVFGLDPRDSLDYIGNSEHLINLEQIYVDAAVNGEGVGFTFLRL